MAARYAQTATASAPTIAPDGLAQLVQMSPAALPGGTRPEAIPPRAAPRKKGVSTAEMAKIAP